MAKTHTYLLTTALVIIIVLLLIIVVKPPSKTVVTVPQQQEPAPVIIPEERTPRAPEVIRGTPTPRAPEPPQQPGGIPLEKVYPQEVNFWVNDILVPPSTAYDDGYNYIPIREHDIKTFAGSFGPYLEDPTPYLRVVLCAALYKVPAAPACEIVPIIYRERYVSFARGYQFDEYIGGQAAKDYIAYYDVFVDSTPVAHSNRAVIRTVSD